MSLYSPTLDILFAGVDQRPCEPGRPTAMSLSRTVCAACWASHFKLPTPPPPTPTNKKEKERETEREREREKMPIQKRVQQLRSRKPEKSRLRQGNVIDKTPRIPQSSGAAGSLQCTKGPAPPNASRQLIRGRSVTASGPELTYGAR